MFERAVLLRLVLLAILSAIRLFNDILKKELVNVHDEQLESTIDGLHSTIVE